MNLKELGELAKGQQEYIVAMRRYFHEHPEVSEHEVHTKEKLMEELDGMGIPYHTIQGSNGLIAILKGGRPGKNKVLRADIDALPLQEDKENLKGPKVCVSQNDGAMHACGHDAHMAMLLGAMKVLKQVQDEIPGTIYCCFEEAEETYYGWKIMLKALEAYPIDEVFALHVYFQLDAGKVNIVPGPRMAGNMRIEFTIKGRAGHGSRPDQSINPINPAILIISQLNSAYNNKLNVEETETLAICELHAGTALNIIPDSIYIGGTSRFFSNTEREKAYPMMNRIIENTAESFGCTVQYEKMHGQGPIPVVNDPAIATRVHDALATMCGPDVLGDCPKWYASEGFCRYMEKYPGALGFVGIQNAEYGSGAPHHNSKFDIDEKGLYLGAAAHLAFVFG